MRRRGLAVGAVATVTAVVAVSSAASAPQALSYSRLAVRGVFFYSIDYGSHPDSVFNGTYHSDLRYNVNTIVAYDGRRISALNGLMLADGGKTIRMNMTQWRSPSSRAPVRCPERGSRGSEPGEYDSHTDVGRFSGGGGVGVSNNRLTLNPGRAIVWSIGCAATESLAIHGLPDGPSLSVPAPRRSLFAGSKAFSIGCYDSYEHDFEPSADVPNTHKFSGTVLFEVRFTPFPASQLTATKKGLRDRAGKNIPRPPVNSSRDCP
jgi:hypothetical protein